MNKIIFDMDGVIFDSERIVHEEWLKIAEKYGLENFDEVYHKCIGANAVAVEKLFKDYYGDNFPYHEYHRERSENYHRKYDGGKLPLKPGVRELLGYLKAEGWYITLASSTRSEVVIKQLKDANLYCYFNKVVCGDMVTRSKPFPDIFIEAVKDVYSSGDEVFVIEDSYNGIRAAKNGNFTAIMVPDLLPPNEEMEKLADYIFNDLIEVKNFLMSKNN